jgi:hypothetical protein
MTMLVCLLLLSAAIIGLCHLLPRMHSGRPFRASLLAIGGFVMVQIGLSFAIAELKLTPKGAFHELLHQLTDYDDERYVVLLIGSSYTAVGIDPEGLARILSGSGRAAIVHRLAVGGAPHIERLHYLKEYLARAKRKPELVLFEIAGGYDSGPLYQVHQMRFSDRMVAAMDGESAWWALRYLAGADQLSLQQRLIFASEILGELAAHVSHVGFFWNSAPSDEAAILGTEESPPPTHLTDRETAELLERAAGGRDLKPDWPREVPTRWMSAFIAEEIATLQRYGASRLGFYSVPSMQAGDVAYARRFCAAMSDFPCIVGEEPELLAALRYGADWYNFDHLQGAGRDVFTRWLGDRLIEMGQWP